MRLSKNGDTVKIHYTGRLEDGSVFDSSKDRQPLEFVLGEGDMIPGFEKGIIGMEQGETRVLTIPPEEGYGSRRDELVVEVEKRDFPVDISPQVGQQLQITQTGGCAITVTVTGMDEEMVTLDANHPLAGHTLLFDVELVEIA